MIATNDSTPVDWGDGSGADTVSTVTSDCNANGTGTIYTITGSHAYAASGPYPVSVTVYDDTNTQSSTFTAAMVVNDPAVTIDNSAAQSIDGGMGVRLTSGANHTRAHKLAKKTGRLRLI